MQRRVPVVGTVTVMYLLMLGVGVVHGYYIGGKWIGGTNSTTNTLGSFPPSVGMRGPATQYYPPQRQKHCMVGGGGSTIGGIGSNLMYIGYGSLSSGAMLN